MEWDDWEDWDDWEEWEEEEVLDQEQEGGEMIFVPAAAMFAGGEVDDFAPPTASTPATSPLREEAAASTPQSGGYDGAAALEWGSPIGPARRLWPAEGDEEEEEESEEEE